ncbi:hypothetical protein HFP89_14250 [Wenzhouxiangella sp. XN79A]|uniref:DUF6644 family protein n=1 Tax=Wenzhouxiangella sp. XN79A TaxID=2724193 RepID=UPI00144AF80B|nr:DUF6644 family protein [Wenzhouxiangella sp. XN79A]NKI36328.1 hypothetical protein [Wenzhouxiangella sp. XN79A]
MLEFLSWLEGSALAGFLRGLGIWTYGLLNLGHILGIASLFGAVLLLDLRLIGSWSSIPATQLIRPCVPVAAAGFLLAALSGLMMVTFNASEYHGNPFFYLKFPLIVAGLINVAVIQRLTAWRRAAQGQPLVSADRRVLAVFGAVSLLLWTGVIACGRMIGYW